MTRMIDPPADRQDGDDVHTTEIATAEALAMRLAVAYYTPLGWAIDDGDDVDPDDLAECLKAMRPVVAEVERIVADRLREAAHVVHVTATPIAEDVVWCDECEEWVESGAPAATKEADRG